MISKNILSIVAGFGTGVIITLTIKSCTADDVALKQEVVPNAVLVQKEDDLYFRNDKYRYDARTSKCFLTHGPHGLTNVPCDDGVMRAIRERKVD